MTIIGNLYSVGLESVRAVLVGDKETYLQDHNKQWHMSYFNGPKLLNAIRSRQLPLEHLVINYRLEV